MPIEGGTRAPKAAWGCPLAWLVLLTSLSAPVPRAQGLCWDYSCYVPSCPSLAAQDRETVRCPPHTALSTTAWHCCGPTGCACCPQEWSLT